MLVPRKQHAAGSACCFSSERHGPAGEQSSVWHTAGSAGRSLPRGDRRRVSCHALPKPCAGEKFDVRGFPTLKWFPRGKPANPEE